MRSTLPCIALRLWWGITPDIFTVCAKAAGFPRAPAPTFGREKIMDLCLKLYRTHISQSTLGVRYRPNNSLRWLKCLNSTKAHKDRISPLQKTSLNHWEVVKTVPGAACKVLKLLRSSDQTIPSLSIQPSSQQSCEAHSRRSHGYQILHGKKPKEVVYRRSKSHTSSRTGDKMSQSKLAMMGIDCELSYPMQISANVAYFTIYSPVLWFSL